MHIKYNHTGNSVWIVPIYIIDLIMSHMEKEFDGNLSLVYFLLLIAKTVQYECVIIVH